jgi:hypothetical protein
MLAENFVNTLQRISAFLASHKAPFIAKVYRPSPKEIAQDAKAKGSVTLWYPK